jgi:uncharacterized membrane protein YhhN
VITTLLLILIALCGVLEVRAEVSGKRTFVYFLKPLTVLLIISLAYHRALHPDTIYSAAILAGLAASLVGDVFLMLKRDYFLAGLISFLCAHLLYILAFALGGTPVGASRGVYPKSIVALVLLVLYGAALYSYLYRRLRALRIPVAVYVIVILLMGWLAIAGWLNGVPPRSGFAAAGALAFMFSDSALAVDRFRGGPTYAKAIVMASYFAAQTLIALSA